MRTEVYSWRLSADLKSDLEREARLRKTSLSAVLDLAARDWLKKSAENNADDAGQRQLQEAAGQYLGAFAGGKARRSETGRQAIRERLRRRHAR